MSQRPERLTNTRSDRVKKVAALSGRSARLRHKQFLVEGPQAVRELIAHAPHLIIDVYGTDANRELLNAARSADLYTHDVSDDVARAMSPDSQGILAVARLEQQPAIDLGGSRLVMILPAVADPGNTGTLIRIADASGADAVVVCTGSVEVTNPKVVRATAGSLFHIPVFSGVTLENALDAAHAAGLNVIGADGLADMSVFDPSFPVDTPTAWMFGNEARGLSDIERAACDSLASIPLYGKAESLNVAAAAAVCMYATARGLNQDPEAS